MCPKAAAIDCELWQRCQDYEAENAVKNPKNKDKEPYQGAVSRWGKIGWDQRGMWGSDSVLKSGITAGDRVAGEEGVGGNVKPGEIGAVTEGHVSNRKKPGYHQTERVALTTAPGTERKGRRANPTWRGQANGGPGTCKRAREKQWDFIKE